jgi:DNA-binding NarL/FixJ family response regulator
LSLFPKNDVLFLPAAAVLHAFWASLVLWTLVASQPRQINADIYTAKYRQMFVERSHNYPLSADAFSKQERRQTRAAIMHRPTKASDIGERFAALSRRQQQVVSLVCDGLTNKMIAGKLGVNEGTVKSHLHAIYDKLGVQSRIALMVASADRNKSTAD